LSLAFTHSLNNRPLLRQPGGEQSLDKIRNHRLYYSELQEQGAFERNPAPANFAGMTAVALGSVSRRRGSRKEKEAE